MERRHLGPCAWAIACVMVVACTTENGVAPRQTPHGAALARVPEPQRSRAEALLNGVRAVGPAPLVYVDGRRATRPEASGRFTVVDPDRIARVEVLTGDRAAARAGEEGRRGVIWITTRDGAGAK